ncbi:MAG: zinc-ribbon domain-containing protein [Candidatus Verstraetearchaeota archaeon]|nr:zinc-ribbon domain-containing protein [Candidatus Verstraetearchaeota archaeon]
MSILLFSTLASITISGVRGATYYTVTVNATGIDIATSNTAITFMGTEVGASKLPREFSVLNGTNATYAWQQYVNLNSTYRYVFVNATLISCTSLPFHICFPFPANRTGVITVTNNVTLNAYYSPEFYLQYSSPTGGSANVTAGWYSNSTTLTISATPNSGYNFNGWLTTGSVSVSNPNSSVTTLTINGPGTVTSLFVAAPAGGIPMEYLLAIVALVIVLAALGFAVMKRKPKAPPSPRPTALRLSSSKKEIFADGKSSAEITVELIDSQGNPVSSDTDREVRLTTTDGSIQPTVTIPKGAASTKASLSSSMRVGEVTVSATTRDLSAQILVKFVEKKRYCMVCGQRMPLDAKTCPSCGNAPPSGADTKTCPNCGAVIPIVAKFCSECGASQST